MSDNSSSKSIEELQRKLKILQLDIAACGAIMENSFKTASQKVSKEIDASKYKLMSLAVSASNSYAKINSELNASCKSIFASMKTSSSNAMKSIGSNIKDTFKSSYSKASEGLKDPEKGLNNFAKEVSSSFKKIGTYIATPFKNAFSVVKGFGGSIVSIGSGIANIGGKALSSIKDIYKDNDAMQGFQDKLSSIKDGLGGVKDTLAKAFEPIINSVMPVLTNLLTCFEPLITGVSQFVEKLFGLDSISPIAKNISGVFQEIANSIVGAIGEIDFSKLKGSIEEIWASAQPIIGNLMEIFGAFFTEILVPLAAWTISDVLPAFFDLVSGALDILNPILEVLMDLGGWFWNEFLQPIAEWTGGIIVDVLNELSDLLSSIGEWIADNKSLIEDIAIVIGAFAAAWGLVTLAMNAYNIVTTITTAITTVLNGVISIFAAVIAFVTSPIGLVVLAIGALIAIGLLLYKHCEGFRNFISTVFATTITIVFGIIQGVIAVLSTTFSVAFGFIGSVLNGFLNNVRNIIDAVKTFFGGIIDFVAGVFTGNWERAINGIAGIFKGIWKGIESAAKAPLNGVISLINGVIGGLNRISFNIGGKHFGVNIPKIPYLAKGGIVNVPTLAMVGENGREAVMPLENNTGWITNLADKISSRMYKGNENNYSTESGNVIFQIDGNVIGQVALKHIRRMQRQGGITVIPV